ncbi:YgfZ/GcvT domain-containing protein [Rhodoferax ferrireducens]|uniref:CAF17-like 4Fe-4S cluster assembly/insertion protein YgfZ n=1 Tax=Rhodoferax ferrireducens TaxID=192843 RepID=UPI000E0E0171|nr:folate-binding protein YgfZ [Rhodoferax ferrireducens]
MKNKLNGVAPLLYLGVIRVEGEDAAKFLHGQLTQDFSLLGQSEARLAAFCSSKGRMQASFYGFKRSPTEILLVCNRDILAATLKRLSMFVLRAKAKLTDASSDYAIYGLAGSAIESIAASAQSAWAKVDIGNASVVCLYPAEGVRRALWLAPVAEAAPAGEALSEQDWAWSEVRSGVAMITTPIMEAFVPQMLNYESVGGVNFKKGCYPGQEVVARSQFRGTLKRRAYLVHSDVAMKAGDEVFLASDTTQPCGTVAQAAAVPLDSISAGFDAIVVLQVSAFEAGGLHLGSSSGPALVVAPPPYPLLADI